MNRRWWIITDTHFGHDKIVEACERPKKHELLILKNISRLVNECDTIIHIGDFAFYDIEKWAIEYKNAINGARSWLVLGNHDKKSASWYLDYFDFVSNGFFMEQYGEIIYFSHRPSVDIGYTINIHGHFHNNDHRSREHELIAIANEKQKLLVIENENYSPVRLDTFIARKYNGEVK